jgi:lipoprotein-anchoring transpeptidase ErfK/SrfK
MGRFRGWVKGLGAVLIPPLVTLGIIAGIHFANRRGDEASSRVATTKPNTSSNGAAAEQASCRWRVSLIGTVSTAKVQARSRPSTGARILHTFGRRNVQGNPQVFLLLDAKVVRHTTWFSALLPVRPNGTTGFIESSQLTLTRTPYHLTVSKEKRRLQLWKGCQKVRTYPVAIGRKTTPTPTGTFYLASLVRPPTANSVYGTYAFGLSGYSAVIRTWKWGGVIGLHGTNDPSSIGHYTSHGCIRLYNQDIDRLVRILPLGTPISIS